MINNPISCSKHSFNSRKILSKQVIQELLQIIATVNINSKDNIVLTKV